LRKLCVSEYRSCELEVQSRYAFVSFFMQVSYQSLGLFFTGTTVLQQLQRY
jgi:hypothetical protein